MTTPCPACQCSADAPAHAIAAALLVDDWDRAIGLGLLDGVDCPACSEACRARIALVRASRREALAARERFRARQARLARRAAERDARRSPAPDDAGSTADPRALPAAAASALERALARVGKPR